jgi:hypothetical protein
MHVSPTRLGIARGCSCWNDRFQHSLRRDQPILLYVFSLAARRQELAQAYGSEATPSSPTHSLCRTLVPKFELPPEGVFAAFGALVPSAGMTMVEIEHAEVR